MHNKTAAIAARLADLQQRSRATDEAAAADLQQLLRQGQQLAEMARSQVAALPLPSSSRKRLASLALKPPETLPRLALC
jgi:hypothetical protein